jgi:hypothetical protein
MKVVDGVVEKLRVVLNRVEGRRMGRLTRPRRISDRHAPWTKTLSRRL